MIASGVQEDSQYHHQDIDTWRNFMPIRSLRKLSVSAALVSATFAVGISLAGPASAAPRTSTYNRADVEIAGGNARALSTCVNVARAYARANRPVPNVQRNRCGGATAVGGTVVVDNVAVVVDQQGGGRHQANTARVAISGGDATAVASCVNYSQGTASAYQANECAGARAQGGNVFVRDSVVTVYQA